MKASPDDPAEWAIEPLTVPGSLTRAARRWPDNEALVIGTERLGFARLLADAVLHARALLGLGVRPGEHVGLLMGNSATYIRLFHAAGLIGARAVLLNARYRESELSHVVAAADIDVLFISGDALPRVDFRDLLTRAHPALANWDGRGEARPATAPRLRAVINLADARERVWPGEAALAAAAESVPVAAVREAAAAVSPDDICLMMFSSGTTALPKACMLTHRSLTLTARAFAERFRLTSADRVYNPLPFFHMSTMLPQAAAREAGATVIAAGHFEAGEGLATLARERATVSYASFPTMMSGLIGHPDFARADLSRLRLVHCVGPVDLMRRYGAAFPDALIFNAYGLTEATGVPCWSDPDDARELSFTTNGRPFAGIEARACDPETGAVLPVGARGEIELRGYAIFAGYHGDEAATAAVMRPGGWLRTGDLGSIDPEGRIIYEGRIKDMIKIGGENVAAIEIENHLLTHPEIVVAQVIGVPDEHYWEVAAAFVELAPGARLTAADVARHCAGRIASFKVPRYVRIVESWPMSATKIQKFELAKGFRPEGKIDPKAL